MYNYWLHRLGPLLAGKGQDRQPVLFFVADRVGTEYSYYDKK